MRHFGPGEAFDGGVATLSEHGRLYYTVPGGVQDCVFCGKPLVYVAGKHDPNYVVIAFIDNVPYGCHLHCRMDAKGDSRPAMARHTKRPKCTRCGESWKDHCHATTEDHGLCPDMIGYFSDEPVRNVA